MAIGKIIAAFEGEETVPIDLGRIKTWILENSANDDIEFVGVNLDVGVIRGFLHRFTYHKQAYADPVMAANIYYGVDQSSEWINIVCCKELIHAGDGSRATGKKAQFDELVKRLVLPRELDILLEDPGHVQVDKLGDVIAAGLLIPPAARELLMPPYNDGTLTPQDISKLAQIPTQYVRMVMSDRWEKAYEVFRKL